MVSNNDVIRIERLELEQFRAYRQLDLSLPAPGLRIIGPNGSGKSTLLEAIELVSTTRPRRGALDSDVIRHESGVELGVAPYARVTAGVRRADAVARIEVFIQRAERRNAARKILKVADRPRRAADVVGMLPTVSFAPDDLDLILGAPSIRRRFLDIMLSQTDRRYLRALSRYARILSQRNGLLKRTAGDDGVRPTPDELAFWDEQLVALGAYVVAARVGVLKQLAQTAQRRFSELAPAVGRLSLDYAASIAESPAWWDGVATSTDRVTAAQRIGVTFEQQLRRGLTQDIARGMTLIGPHRDDVTVSIDGRPVDRFGSRGQQRIAVIAMKLAEVDVSFELLGMRPVLLLDDVLSELDRGHRDALMSVLRSTAGQILVTSSDLESIDSPDLNALQIVRLTAPGEIAIE